MTKLSVLAIALVAGAGGLAAPVLAATPVSNTAPICSSSSDSDYSSRADSLSTQLHLATNPNATLSESNGCLKVTTIEDGKVIMAYYDPDSFALLAKVG